MRAHFFFRQPIFDKDTSFGCQRGEHIFGCRKFAQLDNRYKNRTNMVLQEKLVDFDNPTIVLQPANVVALFFQRAKDAAEAVEDDYAAADKGPAFERRRRNSRRRHSLRKRRRSSSRRRRSIRKRRQSKHSDKTNLPKHGPPVRKSRCNAPSSGKRVRKQPIVRHFQGRLSGREPRSHEFAPVGGSPGVRGRYIRIWLPFSRGVCLPERETLLYKWGEGGGKTSGKYRQRFGKSPGETRLHADGPCAHGRDRRRERQHNSRDNCENRERHAPQGEQKMERRDCRVFRGEMRCFRSPSGGDAQRSACFRKIPGGLWLRDLQHRLHTGFFWSSGPRSACRQTWFSKGGGFLHGNRRKRADNSRKHKHRRGARLHLDIHHRGRAHSPHKNIQQSRVEFEAGEIREPVGGHLADYVDCPNPHLRQTFLHPDVQARGCTRIEVSLYACPQNELSSKKATDYIEKVLEQVSTEDEEDGLFVVQPLSKQWQNLAESLNRCLVLADRPRGHILFVGWYAHTGTGRISGIHVHPTPAKVQDETKWEKAILCSAGVFGFRNCPIFRVDILAADEVGVELGPLRCYKKDENARTILSASKKPTQLHPNGGDPSKLLPPTDKIVWEWRYKICYAIGNDSSKYKLQEIQEIQEIGEQRKISALSTRNREKDLAELRYASTVEEWKREKWQREEKRRKKRGGSGKGPRSGNFQPAKVRRGEEKNRSKKPGDSCSGDWYSVWGDTKGCRIASRQKMGCPRFSRQRRQSPGCITAWKRRGSCCLGDKRFATNPTRMCGLLPFGQERQLWLAAFLASVFLWFRKTWRAGVAHRTFEKFPKLGRKNHRVEPHSSGIQMRGVRSPS